jgi:hypothetical protein
VFGFGDGFPPESIFGLGSDFDFEFLFWVHGDFTRSEPDSLPSLRRRAATNSMHLSIHMAGCLLLIESNGWQPQKREDKGPAGNWASLDT